MGNQPPIEKTTILNNNNIEQTELFGYAGSSKGLSTSTGINNNPELTNFFKNMIQMFNYEIRVNHNEYNQIIDPILVIDKTKQYKIFRYPNDFHNIPENRKYVNYALVVNDRHTYKFSHISNVQFYFESINNKYAE